MTRQRAATVLGVVLSLGLLALHLQYHRSAGALWRDEVTSVNVATIGSFADVLANTHYDSFPVAWQTVLHPWIAAGLGADDASLRRLGLLIGLATIAVVWWAGARLGVGPPLVTLLLFGMSPTTIIYGDQVRGYGLAALAIAWCFGALWAFVARPSGARFVVALAAAIAATQTHYANIALLAAIGAGAAAVCAMRRDWRLLGTVAALGVVAALSLLIDLRDLRYITGTAAVSSGSWGLAFLLRVFLNALAPGVTALAVAWGLGVLGAIAGVVAGLRGADRERAVFVVVTAPLALAGSFAALLQAGVPTNYWHYLSLMVVSALAIEMGVALLVRHGARRDWLRVGGVAVAALLAAPAVSRAVPLRMTSLDVVAQKLGDVARPDDLIVVFPWYCGITFERYYRGPAPWITWPEVPEHKVHSHLVIADKMRQGSAAIAPELARVEATLRGGHTVWVVGSLAAPDPSHPVGTLPPAAPGARSAPYLDDWELQLGRILETRALAGGTVPLGDLGPVNVWENLPLVQARGWRPEPRDLP